MGVMNPETVVSTLLWGPRIQKGAPHCRTHEPGKITISGSRGATLQMFTRLKDSTDVGGVLGVGHVESGVGGFQSTPPTSPSSP